MDKLGEPPFGVDLERLRPGTHLCRFYDDESDLALGAATYVGMGLAAGDRVVYVSDDRDPAEARASFERHGVEATRALASGQLVLCTSEEVYGEGPVDLAELESGFRALQAKARADGLAGLRVAAEMGEAVVRFGSLTQVVAWEATATRLQGEIGISSVCQYDRRRFSGADLTLIGAEHLGPSPGTSHPPLARLSITDDGLRVAGELDISNSRRFIEVVEARTRAVHRLELDLAELAFMDVGTAEALYGLVRRRPHLVVTIRNTSRLLRRYLRLAELEHPRVHVT